MGLEKYKITEPTQDENLIFYNESEESLGIIDREEGIKRGLLLEGVQLWIINPDTKEVLMQKRSKNKKSNPGKIDVSVSGHVKPNETAIQAILREAREEIGIKNSQKLFEKMQKITQNQIDLREYGRQGNYIMTFFVAFLNNTLDMYVKDDEEVEELFFMEYEELKRRIREEDPEMLIPKSEKTEGIFSILDDKIRNLNKENIRKDDNRKER